MNEATKQANEDMYRRKMSEKLDRIIRLLEILVEAEKNREDERKVIRDATRIQI
jgi:hypothetical protein